jgi:hypothetical protein
MTDPKPNFVSVVKAGANQTPFRAVRIELSEDTQMPKDVTTSDESPIIRSDSFPVPAGFEIAAFRFDKDAFPSEGDVKKWLEDGGYTDTEIRSEDGAFVVENTTVEFSEGATQKIESHINGLTVFVGSVKGEQDPAQKTEHEDAAARAAEAGSGVIPVAPLASKKDEKPLTPGEVISGLTVKFRGMDEAGSLAYFLRILKWMLEDAQYTGMSETAQNAIKTGAQSLIVAMADISMQAVSDMEAAFRADPELSGLLASKGAGYDKSKDKDDNTDDNTDDDMDDTDEAAKGGKMKKKGDTPQSDPAQSDPAPSDPVQSVKESDPAETESVMSVVTALSETVRVLTEKVEALAVKWASVAEPETVERDHPAAGTETAAQTRKGSGVPSPVQSDSTRETDAQRAAERFRRSLGMHPEVKR